MLPWNALATTLEYADAHYYLRHEGQKRLWLIKQQVGLNDVLLSPS